MVVKIKTFCLTFDIEEFDIPKGISEEEMFKVSEEGTKTIVRLLDEENIKATFFVTSTFAAKYPELTKIISKKHEVGSHGYSHQHEYKDMDKEKAYEFIKKSKEEIEKITKKEVKGFRAPRMNICNYEILKKAGFEYDASMHPTYIPGRYNNFFKPRKLHREKEIIIVPVSVVPLIRLPFTWYWFRNYGLLYAKTCTILSAINNKHLSLYFHPWEFVDLTKYGIDKGIKRNTGHKLEKRMREYIIWCKKRYNFKTINEMITQEVLL